MDQERIGNLIKKLREKDKLTQKEFADKYNVTHQAVSKWERGLNIPDIMILKDICEDHNISLSYLLNGKDNLKKYNKLIISIIIVVVIIIITVTGVIIYLNNSNTLKVKLIESSCEDFKITGTIAYTKKESVLSLNNIFYCGDEGDTIYDNIECTLYEKDNDTIKTLEKCNNDNQNISLDEYLKNIEFNLADFSNSCSKYDNNSLYLEINATKKKKTTNYKIPLNLSNCNE